MTCRAFPLVRSSDRILVERAAAGDRDAFAELYDQSVPKIYRYIYYKVGRKSDAEDLTSLVFLRAWQAIGNYEWRERPFSSWLYCIAHNAVVDYFRTRRTMVPLDDIADVRESEVTLDDMMQQRWTVDSLRRAFVQLTEDQRDVVILRFLNGFDTGEVAQIMDKTRGAVRTLQHRALARLSKVLTEHPEFSVLEVEFYESV